MSTRNRRVAAAAGAAFVMLLAAGCAHNPQSVRSAAAAEYGGVATTLVVRNDNFADVNVFVVRQGVALSRLGTVTGESSGRFTIPSSLFPDGMLALAVKPIGGNSVVPSGMLTVSPGQTVTFMVQPYLPASTAFVR